MTVTLPDGTDLAPEHGRAVQAFLERLGAHVGRFGPPATYPPGDDPLSPEAFVIEWDRAHYSCSLYVFPDGSFGYFWRDRERNIYAGTNGERLQEIDGDLADRIRLAALDS